MVEEDDRTAPVTDAVFLGGADWAEEDAAEFAVLAPEARGSRRAPSACFGLGRAAGRAAAGVVPLAASPVVAPAAEGRTPRRLGGIMER